MEPVKLSTFGVPTPLVAETSVKRAEAPSCSSTAGVQRPPVEPEPFGRSTRLTLWHNIDRYFISWGTGLAYLLRRS